MSDDKGSKPSGEGSEAPSKEGGAASSATESEGSQGPRNQDVVFVRGPSADGRGLNIVRMCDDKLTAGELREAKQGQPIMGELVRLSQRSEHERLFDVEVIAKGHEPQPTEEGPRKGPSRVASDAYRAGWETIFGNKKKPPADVN